MRKYFLVLFFISAFAFSNAQITITSADLPQIGESYLISTDSTPIISIGSASPSFQTWNFTSLTQDYPSIPTYGSTSATPHAAAFFESNLYTYGPAAFYSSFYGGAPVGSQGMNKGYMFWKTDPTGFWVVGFRADSGTYSNINVFEAPKELLIGTPATYATTFNNSGRWVLPMNFNSMDLDTFYVNIVTKVLTTDAWGSISTPGGIFSNVIRIHESVIKVDSVYGKIGASTVSSLELKRDTLNNYLFMANSIHYPVCIVHADKYNIVKDVEYYTSTVLLNASERVLNENVHVYPNPANSHFTIELPNEFYGKEVIVTLFDISGREVFNGLLRSNVLKIDCTNYDDGIYFYKIQYPAGEKLNGKLLIVK